MSNGMYTRSFQNMICQEEKQMKKLSSGKETCAAHLAPRGYLAIYLSLIFYLYIGFHSRWNKAMGAIHPSLWVFIQKAKDDECGERLHLRRARKGQNEMKLKHKFCCLERRIKRIRREYCASVRPVPGYWPAISYAVKDYR
jgi:hypothetical protein